MTHTFKLVELRIAQAVIDVVASEATHQSACQRQLFNRGMRAGQKAHRIGTKLRLDVSEAVGHILQRSRPINFHPHAVLLDHGRGQALVAVQRFVRKAVAVRDPAFVNRVVFKRHHAHSFVVFNLHDEVGACAVVGANRLASR